MECDFLMGIFMLKNSHGARRPSRRHLALVALALMLGLGFGCTSIVDAQQSDCLLDQECQEAFGLGSACVQGFCSAPGADVSFVNGVSTTTVRTVGIADISGALSDLGGGMRDGVLAAYAAYNRANPSSRQFQHEVRDDAYDPAKSAMIAREVTESGGPSGRYAFAVVGSMGSPTSSSMLPILNERQVPLFGTYSGANHLRKSPPDRVVWNTRASYSREGEVITNYLIKRDFNPIAPRNLFAFSQSPLSIDTLGKADLAEEVVTWLSNPTPDPNDSPLDPYGLSGYRGVIDALDGRLKASDIPLGSYRATTTNTQIAQAFFFRWLGGLESRFAGPDLSGDGPEVGVVMVPVASAATDFVTGIIDGMNQLKQDSRPNALSDADWMAISDERKAQLKKVRLTIASISPAGDQLALNLKNAGPQIYCSADYPIIVSQVVPFPQGSSAGAIAFRKDIEALDPNITPGYVNFEGWIAGKVFIEAVNQVEGEPTVDKLIEVLESPGFRVNLGIGEPISFSQTSHDGSRSIYGSRLNTMCRYEEFDVGS